MPESSCSVVSLALLSTSSTRISLSIDTFMRRYAGDPVRTLMDLAVRDTSLPFSSPKIPIGNFVIEELLVASKGCGGGTASVMIPFAIVLVAMNLRMPGSNLIILPRSTPSSMSVPPSFWGPFVFRSRVSYNSCCYLPESRLNFFWELFKNWIHYCCSPDARFTWSRYDRVR